MSSFSDRCSDEDETDRLSLVQASIGRISNSRLTAAVREEREADLSASKIRASFRIIALELMDWDHPSTTPSLVSRLREYGI